MGQVRKREILKSSRVRFEVRALKQAMGDKSMQRNILETEVENVVAQRGGQEHEILSHVANARRRHNFISKINSRGRLIKESAEVKEEVAKFCEDLYSSAFVNRPSLDGIVFTSINSYR